MWAKQPGSHRGGFKHAHMCTSYSKYISVENSKYLCVVLHVLKALHDMCIYILEVHRDASCVARVAGFKYAMYMISSKYIQIIFENSDYLWTSHVLHSISFHGFTHIRTSSFIYLCMYFLASTFIPKTPNTCACVARVALQSFIFLTYL